MPSRRLFFALWMASAPVGGAAAADLLVAVDPIDYVRVCDAYGAGYFHVPGTDTCMRIRSRVRTDYNVFFNSEGDFDFEPNFGFDTNQNAYRFRARGYFYSSTRTQTQFGELRSHIQLRITKDNDNTPVTDLHESFVELGNLQLGRAESWYLFQDAQFTPNTFFDAQFARDHPVNLIAYRAELFDRFSAVLSVEDTTDWQAGISSQMLATNYGGAQIPDVVFRLAWGEEQDPFYAQLMGATHYVNTVTQGVGTTSRQLGFAVGGGLASDVPLGNKTRLGITSTFARGALTYATTSAIAPYGLSTDGVYVNGTDEVKLSNYLSVAIGGRTYIAPDWEIAFESGFLYGDLPDANTDFNNNGVVDDLDYINFDFQGFVGWRGISGVLIGVGAEYRYVDTADFGSSSFLTTFLRAQATF